jgi:ADP-ribosylglycohydrolase
LGVPFEGMPGAFVRSTRPRPWKYRFVFGRGLVSDDTDHTVFVCQCLTRHGSDVKRFTRRLAWCLRWWFASLPSGIGRATYLSSARLWIGFPPAKSGIFSAGNGPAMRAAPFGAYFSADPAKMETFLRAATRITHSDEKAMVGAMAVAETAAWVVANDGAKPGVAEFAALIGSVSGAAAEWTEAVGKLEHAAETGAAVGALCLVPASRRFRGRGECRA